MSQFLDRPIDSITRVLADRLAQPVDATTRVQARLHLLDWLGCVAGGRAEVIFAVAKAGESEPIARAALLGNALEMDDVDRLGRLHPGPVIWPAALAATRHRAATMADLLDGGVRGYEAMICIGRMFDDHHYALWHPTATAGGFGAAAAAGSLLGLTRAQTVSALGNAGSVAGGLWRMRHEPVLTKAMHAAYAARSGVWLARLAAQGLTGPERILEGEQGVFAAMVEQARPLTGNAGWRLLDVSFKPYPACRHAHAAIDAALMLKTMPGNALSGDGPIIVETYGDALRFCDQPDPVTAMQAKFSLQHAVAVVAAKGVPELADFEPAVLSEFAAGRARVTVVQSPAFDAAYPAHFGARIAASGQATTAHDALGDPEMPVGRVEITAKLAALCAWGGLEAGESDAALALVMDSPDDAPVAPLHALLDRWMA